MAPKNRQSITEQAAEQLAIQGLTFIGSDPERLGRFLALSGMGPGDLRAAAHAPLFLVGVLDHILGDDRLLVEFANEAEIDPALVERARNVLAGPAWEREVP